MFGDCVSVPAGGERRDGGRWGPAAAGPVWAARGRREGVGEGGEGGGREGPRGGSGPGLLSVPPRPELGLCSARKPVLVVVALLRSIYPPVYPISIPWSEAWLRKRQGSVGESCRADLGLCLSVCVRSGGKLPCLRWCRLLEAALGPAASRNPCCWFCRVGITRFHLIYQFNSREAQETPDLGN